MLIGRPDSNAVAARLVKGLPVTFGPASFVLRGETYAHPGSAVVVAGSNPLNPRYSVVVFAGLGAEATWQCVQRLPDDELVTEALLMACRVVGAETGHRLGARARRSKVAGGGLFSGRPGRRRNCQRAAPRATARRKGTVVDLGLRRRGGGDRRRGEGHRPGHRRGLRRGGSGGRPGGPRPVGRGDGRARWPAGTRPGLPAGRRRDRLRGDAIGGGAGQGALRPDRSRRLSRRRSARASSASPSGTWSRPTGRASCR